MTHLNEKCLIIACEVRRKNKRRKKFQTQVASSWLKIGRGGIFISFLLLSFIAIDLIFIYFFFQSSFLVVFIHQTKREYHDDHFLKQKLWRLEFFIHDLDFISASDIFSFFQLFVISSSIEFPFRWWWAKNVTKKIEKLNYAQLKFSHWSFLAGRLIDGSRRKKSSEFIAIRKLWEKVSYCHSRKNH